MHIPINISLFAHIELDSELSGRVGVQGNIFSHTFGYLNQYFKTLLNLPPQVQKLAAAMDALVMREAYIRSIRGHVIRPDILKYLTPYFEMLPNIPTEMNDFFTVIYNGIQFIISLFIRFNTLDAFTLKTATEIDALQPNQNLLLPGGWLGTDRPGHAMIYQFEKKPNGDLFFSIYNSGAGIQQHDQTSSTEKALYSPVKTYHLPGPVDPIELQQLIKRLVVPQLATGHPARDNREFNAEMVYNDIGISLDFLNASLVLSDLSSSHTTTGGQLSGTCAQRSIHQMLKINFDTLPAYQRFIFDFKMHALNDFIATNPSPRSAGVTALIQKAIINNLKILQEPGVFHDETDKAGAVDALKRLQQQLQHDEATVSSVFQFNLVHFSTLWSAFTNLFMSNPFDTSIASFDASEMHDAGAHPSLMSPLREEHLLPDLAEIIRQCHAQQETHPLWVMAKIEQTVLQLPIPLSTNNTKPYFITLPFYNAITTAIDFETMGNSLDELHHLYAEASEKMLQEATLPTQIVTYCSLLALRDYFDATGESVTHQPTFHRYLHRKLADYLSNFRGYPYLATGHPVSDQRLMDLIKISQNPEPTPDPVKDYQALLDAEPDLKATLEGIYESKWHFYDRMRPFLLQKKQTALYCLLGAFDEHGQLKYGSALATERFKPLIKTMQQRFVLERVLTSYLKPLIKKEYFDRFHYHAFPYEDEFGHLIRIQYRDSHPIYLYDDLGYSTFFERVFIYKKYIDYEYVIYKSMSDCVSRYKYNVASSWVRRALSEYYGPRLGSLAHMAVCEFDRDLYLYREKVKSINQIQLLEINPSDHVLNHYFARDLFHLRYSHAHQIKLTLNYFSKSESIDKLSDQNIQRYVEANLFEPGLLFRALEEQDGVIFFSQLHDFIEKGLRYFARSDGGISQESLFFIRLKIDVHRYAALNHPNAASLKRLQANHVALNKWIGMETDSSTRASLHVYRFINAMTLHSLQSADHALLQEVFLSYVYLQAHQNAYLSEDITTRFEQQRAGLYFTEWLKTADPVATQALVLPMMQSLGLDTSHLTLAGVYPRFEYRDEVGETVYTVHIEQGRVFQKGYSLSVIPLDIKNHAVTNRLGLDHENACWLSEDGQTILFKNSPVRMKKEGGTLAVQKEWALNGAASKWYQLQPLTDKQQRLFGFRTTRAVHHTLQAILTDGCVEAWVCATDSILVKDSKPIYQMDAWGRLHQLDDQNQRNGLMISKPPSHYEKIMAQFEDPKFVCVNLDKTSITRGTIDFARYGFSLNVSGNNVTLPDTDYTWVDSSPLGTQIAALTFSNGRDERCMVAVQRVYIDENTPQIVGEYYRTQHDISGHVPIKKLTQNEPENELPIWKHHRSQRTITYRLVNGALRPETAADACYLCYLYLATHETVKAWAVLEDIRQRLSLDGSMQERIYLSWVIDALPVIFNQEKEADRKFKTPEYVACQLKALALYADFLKLGEPSEWSQQTPYDLSCANGLYEQMCRDEMISFETNLSATIYYLYARHQQGARHLDHAFRLRDEECKSLLDVCDPFQSMNGAPIAYGALGYERRRLSLKRLLKDHQRLMAIRDSSPDFSPDFAKQLAHIEKNMTDELKVMKQSTSLEWIPLNLVLSQTARLNEQCLSSIAIRDFRMWQHDVFQPPTDMIAAFCVLNSGINPDDLIHYFPTYLHLARSGSLEQQAHLKQFCTRFLTAHRHDYSANMPYLTHILYCVLENPTKFQGLDKKMSLEELTQVASRCEIAAILVPQANNVYEAILTSNRCIWDDLKRQMLALDPMPALTSMYPKSFCQELYMMDLMKTYRTEEMMHQQSMQTVQDESAAGALKIRCVNAQRRIAESVLNDPALRMALMTKATDLQIEQQRDLECIWDHAMKQANAEPKNPIQLLAKQTPALTQKDLLTFYLHADFSLYIEHTGLSKSACIALHECIHHCVSLEVRHQQTTRLLAALNRTGINALPQSRDLHEIAYVLMSENIPEAQIDPGLMLFQYEEDVLVRPRQVEALTALLSKPNDPRHVANTVEKIIMGGGKSKVILPLLVEKKATGLNLVVVEVPRALLATNHVDLNATSQRLFGRKAHRFEFNRDSDCSEKRLEKIHQTFVEIMGNRDYLVTTGESMQSLELKYLEFLLFRSNAPEWKKQVYWAGKIIDVIKKCGDVVIDEVHQGLLLKKKLNYTLGGLSAISPALIQHSIALYQFVDVLEGQSPMIDALLQHPNSPLNPYLEKLNSLDAVREIRAYFNNETMPVCIEQTEPEIKDALAFYKEQLTLLPQTQARHYKEHYGPFERQGTALERALAIPYVASNQPNERSRFGNALETINYSIQSLLNEGLNEALLRQAIGQWQAQARHALFAPFGKYQSIGKTCTAQRVNAWLKGTNLTLQTINLRSERSVQQILDILNHLRDERSILFFILQENILPQITIESAVLHSDAYNHVDMYRTAQGLSGTPWNHSTYHQCLQYNPRASLGTDGYIQAVLKEKSTEVNRLSFIRMDVFLLSLFRDQSDARAIIDLSATFAGFSNLDVARQLATCSAAQNPSIQYILYFNEADVLYAFHVQTQQSILLATSDPDEINQKLRCTPHARLTYYDQSHAVGTDLKQAPTAHAFVLVDSRTHLNSFLQGCMRMRGLEYQQTVSIIVPENTPNALDDLFALMAKNEHDQLKQDNFYAGIANMDNAIRQDFLQRIAAVPEEDMNKKHELGQVFMRYFIETKKQTLFEQYGNICIEQNTRDWMEQHHIRLMQDWKRCLAEANITLILTEIGRMNEHLRAIVKRYTSLCNETFMGSINQYQALGVQVELEKEKLKEAQKEKIKEAVCFYPKLKEKTRHAWKCHEEGGLLSSFITEGITDCMHPINTAIQSMPIFSNNFLVDDNYAHVYEGQDRMLCPYLKPVEAILFRKYRESVTACLIDMMDLVEINGWINDYGENKAWISTAQHTILAGSFPENMMKNVEYQALIEQIRFFNGECNGLREQEAPLCWLNHDTDNKLAFFREHIMPYRQTTASEFNHLQTVLSPDISTMASPEVEGMDSIPRIGGLSWAFFNNKSILHEEVTMVGGHAQTFN